MTSSNNKDFRSTFFTMKQSHIHQSKDKSEDADGDSVKVNNFNNLDKKSAFKT